MINVSPEEYAQLLQKPFCTPDDLERAMDYHRCVLDAWLKQHQDRALVPTRPTLQKLVNLVYHVSLLPEEGRFPRFTICVPSRQPWSDAMAMQFQPIPLYAVDDLRKVAPIAAQHGSALRLEEREGGLSCVGLMTLQGIVVGPSPIGLLVRVNGPGDIWCAEFEYMLKLKGGRIRHLQAAHYVPAVRDWFGSLGQRMADHWISSKGQNTPGPWADSRFQAMAVETATQLVGFFWSSMLDAAIDLRHGGMFVVLDDPGTSAVKTKYSSCATAPLQELSGYFGAEMDSRASVMRSDAQLMEHWQKLTGSISSLAHLSAVDGSVVFDRSMVLRSFGGEIRVNEHEIGILGKTLVEGSSETEILESQIMNYGTRHRSAIRLCQAVDGAIAFVISQDGDLRVFHSDGRRVRRWDNLNAITYPDKW